ncbi:MAG: tetratricopeptide repeat protein [Eggerthellaceae bacterium]|nr:tetratricopeptide repeat protein [Eggerthellaceae bacterium]
MNNELFEQANQAYKGKDYQAALQFFTACLQDPEQPVAPGEVGLLYHQIGNCLVKLGNNTEAVKAYTQATMDAEYDELGTVNCNLGMAYAGLHDYENAVPCFEAAAADPNYSTPYKAYSGLGNALIKLGKSAEAGAAFRSAALDEGNPDPTKALLNLGVCFMALDRPDDAIFSYESALQFRMQPATRNKIYASLGQAYASSGQMQKAVNAFEHALADKTYFLSDSASVDYQRAIGAVAQGTATDMEPITPSMVAATTQASPADTSGLDIVDESYDAYGFDVAADQADQDLGLVDSFGDGAAAGTDAAPEGMAPVAVGSGDFFAEPVEWEEPKKKHTGLKVAIAILIVLILAAGGAIFAYTQGYGYPMQETVATKLFANPTDKDVYAPAVNDTKISELAAYITPDSAITIDGVEKSMSTSTVYVTSKTAAGGPVKYKVTMVRDKIGWKVSNVELFFASQYSSNAAQDKSAKDAKSSSTDSTSKDAKDSKDASASSTSSGNGAQADSASTNGNAANTGNGAQGTGTGSGNAQGGSSSSSQAQ